MTRRFDDRCHKLGEYSIGAAEQTVNLGQGMRIGTRKRDHPLRVPFRSLPHARQPPSICRNGNFVFYGGDNFSGDDGATDYSTDI
jgi:hypothetical protein